MSAPLPLDRLISPTLFALLGCASPLYLIYGIAIWVANRRNRFSTAGWIVALIPPLLLLGLILSVTHSILSDVGF